MLMEHYPQDGHDWLPDKELIEAEELSRLKVESKYQDDVAVFRARLFARLQIPPSATDKFWAEYKSVSVGIDASGVEQARTRRILVFTDLGVAEHGAVPMPDIRIFVNEVFSTIDGGSLVMSEDMMVDHDGDAAYCIDSVRADGEVDAKTKLFKNSLAVLFELNEEGLMLKSLRPLVPIMLVDGSAALHDPDTTYLPFGWWGEQTHKEMALQHAMSVCDEIYGAELTHMGHN